MGLELARDFQRCRHCEEYALSPDMVSPGGGENHCTSCHHNYKLFGDLRDELRRERRIVNALVGLRVLDDDDDGG